MCVDSGKWRIIVIDRLYIYLTGRGWGMWCGSWMNVNGGCGVARGWGYMGNWCVRGCRFMGNRGWTLWSNPNG